MAGPVVYERGATLNWEIENFDLLPEMDLAEKRCLRSPVCKVNEGNIWCTMYVCHRDSGIVLYMNQLQEVSVNVRYDASIISSYGEVPLIKSSNNDTLSIEKDAVFGDKKQSMLPNNTLTLRCRILGETMKNQELRICSVLHSTQYLWNIQHFNSSRPYKIFVEQNNVLLSVSLNKKNNGITKVVVHIVPKEEICASIVDCTLSTTNGCELYKNKRWFFPFAKWSCDIENLPENKEIINVQFRSIVSLHKVRQIVPPSPRADDLLLLYKEGTLSDATLNTEGKSFSAHRSILAARSPVFRAMFEKEEMNEGRSGVVDIDDLDSETVERMLVFLYGEKLDDVKWEEASALYYAADKYDVPSLKRRCVDILKARLAVDNACDVLVLADRHSDEQLKKYVVDFISDHREVFSSSQWEKLEESNPLLTTKIIREVYVKKKK